jgi:CRP-like cAMP-binding protein
MYDPRKGVSLPLPTHQIPQNTQIGDLSSINNLSDFKSEIS